MRKTLFIFLTVLLLALASFAQVPPSKHVVMVALENTSYGAVTATSMPWLTTQVKTNALAESFYATTHPSIGNYFSATMGQIITNSDGSTTTRTEDNMVRRMITAGVTWKSYAENLPSVGYTGGDKYPYVLHHNPFAYFSDVRNSSSEKLNLVPFTQFSQDVSAGQLPQFSFIVPNMHHNAHDCPDGMTTCTKTQKLQAADSWMKTNLASLLATPDFQPGGDGVLVVWFDEAATTDTNYGGGHVYVVVIGPNVKHGYKNTAHYNHYGLLKTELKALGITAFPAKSAYSTNASMDDLFSQPTPPPTSGNTVTIEQPIASETQTSPVLVKAWATAVEGATVTKMSAFLDGVSVFTITNQQSLVDYINTTAGTHRITVTAWNSAGSMYHTTVYITVGVASTTPPPTSTATIFSKIEEMSGWQMCSACAKAGGGATTSMTQHISSPSLDGSSTKFTLGGTTPWSHALYYRRMSSNTTATHFQYEVNYYMPNPSASSGFEYSASQRIGYLWYRWDWQCSFVTGGWRVWDNHYGKWIETGYKCTRPIAKTWTHVMFEGQRANGKTLFVAVTVNGVRHVVNKSFAPRKMSSTASSVNIHFQLNGNSTETDYYVYGDSFKLTYW